MKKRLFITTALMTAVLGCSLATGTYAWYTATGAGFQGAEGTVGVAAAGTTYTVGEITLKVGLAKTGAAPDLVDANGKTWYYTGTTNGGQDGVGKTEDTTNVKSQKITASVTATVDRTKQQGSATSPATDEELAAIHGTYTIAITDDCKNAIKYKVTEDAYTGADTFSITVTITEAGKIQIAAPDFYYSIIGTDTVEKPLDYANVTITGTISQA